MNRLAVILLCSVAFAGTAATTMADEQTSAPAPQAADAPIPAVPQTVSAPAADPAQAEDESEGAPAASAPADASPTPETTPASVTEPVPAPADTQVASTQTPAPLSATAPVAALMQDPKLATFMGQWKLNDGSTTTGVVQVTQAGKDVTMTVVQETRYRVDWTLFGPPFATNWPLLQGKVDENGVVAWTYYDTVPGCWTNKAVPVTPTVTADQRRVDFHVATFKAITCQPDDKAPTMAFKLTRQP